MAKKAARRKVAVKRTASPKYKHFRLHGDHTPEKVYVYAAIALVTGIALGLLLQGLVPMQ
jgi:hypothetical protein